MVLQGVVFILEIALLCFRLMGFAASKPNCNSVSYFKIILLYIEWENSYI